jgi:molybdenum cofactor cytidylyltransferase
VSGPVGLLLAAGSATRFGSDKRWHFLPNGKRMALAAAEVMRAGIDGPVWTVLRPGDTEGEARFRQVGCKTCTAPQAMAGMGHSIAAGVSASAAASGWVIGLADMPFVSVATIAAVRAALLEGAGIVVPVYNGQRGHPVGFAARFGEALQRLHGDQGARALIATHAKEVVNLPVDDPGAVRDVDVPGDVQGGPR